MRTSWNDGLMTSAATPMPRARPRTNVVLPAPRPPPSRSRSPAARWAPSRSPAASVSSGDSVTRSRKVVPPPVGDVDAVALAVQHHDRSVAGQLADGVEAGRERRGTHADELHLLPARDRLERRRALGRGHPCQVQARPDAGRKGELVELAQQPVRDVAAAEAGRAQLGPQRQAGPRPGPLEPGTPERAGHADPPAGARGPPGAPPASGTAPP